MDIGKHYLSNDKKISQLSSEEIQVALKKCKDYIAWRLFQKTLYGANSETNLGGDPVLYYLDKSLDKILFGDWEWKDKFDLSEQLIRIANSLISTEIEKFRKENSSSFSKNYIQSDIEEEFYNLAAYDENENNEQEKEYIERYNMVEEAVKGDDDLEILWEAIQDGLKRKDIADLMGVSVERIDKLQEKLKNKTKKIKNLS